MLIFESADFILLRDFEEVFKTLYSDKFNEQIV